MNFPEQYSLKQLVKIANKSSTYTETKLGQWVPSRPLGYPSWRRRFILAWKVFTGKADVVVWPEDE